ncbi:hypothetical protein U1Q18_007644 [Sarracenia purpurea var. burkii]
MPGLSQRNEHQFGNATSSLYSLPCSNGSVSTTGFWSKHRNDVSYNQLQKFWSDLSAQARQELLRIDKQALFEQARKNMYCSRCNGLLLEGFLQIVMFGKSLQQEGAGGHLLCNRQGASKIENDGDLGVITECKDEVQDPSVHPWGGLTTTRDGTLTLLDCYLYSKSLKRLQIVFDSACARERERELLYPDACGGTGRGWISQGMAGYGRGHGARETCALHTARLSVDTLVDFWSALGEETRQSLLRMKEEDFIERLMYRFDSKRFCRDCRRNVIHEFKELKELKRMRKEPRCTSWFCVADTAFQYEVSHDTVQADWHQSFNDNVRTCHYFEWAIGTGEGRSDILEFENVGTSRRVQVNGLDLGGLNACYITLRAWKIDGRCTELSVKAHALKGEQCVHCRLAVGDGFVTITRGESIRRFFEHAEEAEEEEDDDSMDKDGNELDGECSRPQKHAKSPELAREFLLDAATIIFKEQVEKAFREGTARQNAHSIFVCLSLKLLEERVHVACKEIITLEKQMKLLEEEEKEKREEEERKERRRTKEREKKLRRKERLRSKEKDREKKSSESDQSPVLPDVPTEEASPSVDEQQNFFNRRELIFETGNIPSRPLSIDAQDEQLLNGSIIENHSDDSPDGELSKLKDGNGLFTNDNSKLSPQNLKVRKEFKLDPTLKWSDRRRFAVVSESGGMVSKSEPRQHDDNFKISSKRVNGLNKQLRDNSTKSNNRNGGPGPGPKFGEGYHCINSWMSDRYDFRACSYNQHNGYKSKVETKSVSMSESASDLSKPYYRGKYNKMDYIRENFGRPKSKIITGNTSFIRDSRFKKKVWEPMESQRKYARSDSDIDVTSRSSMLEVEGSNETYNLKSFDAICSEVMEDSDETSHKENFITNSPSSRTCDPSMSSTSNSDNCSSCLSEVDSNMASSNSPNLESLSSSDSEDAGLHSDGRATPDCIQNCTTECHKSGIEKEQIAEEGEEAFRSKKSSGYSPDGGQINFSISSQPKAFQNLENGIKMNVISGSCPHQVMLPPIHNQSLSFPIFQGPSMGYYHHQSPVSWPAAPANGLLAFPHPNHYIFSSPFGFSPSQPIFQPPSMGYYHQVPIYQPTVKTNCLNSMDQTNISKPSEVKKSFNEPNVEGIVPVKHCPLEEPRVGDGVPNGNSNKLLKENSDFSLFHFGGPVALSQGYKLNSVPCKGDIVGDLSSDLSADPVEDDCACDKKDNVEEYNLFAASNGIKFSFF